MSSSGDTPRQKMINVMYLVLTAMLSITVSKEVMIAFNVVNDSVLQSNERFTIKIKDAYAALEKDFLLNQTEMGPVMNKAKKVEQLSSETIKYIENLRDELISKTEKIPLDSVPKINVQDLKNKEDYVIPTSILMGSSEDGSNGRARELKNKINDFRENIINLVDPKDRARIKIGMKTDGEYRDASGEKQTWEVHNFYDIPLAADIPILNKMISDVYNAQLDVVSVLHSSISANDFRYDKVEAKILPKTNYLFTGEQYEAEVIVAAYDTTQSPNIYFMPGVDSLPVSNKDQATLITSRNGRVRLSIPAVSEGLSKYAGFVSLHNNSGVENTYHFHSDFMVSRPTLAVSATNMNVLYVGVNNPLSISVSGIPPANIFPSISCGSLKQNGGKGGWTASVTDACKQAVVTVSVKINGEIKQIGTQNFRVKKLPDPDPFIANVKSGFVSREMVIAAGTIIARMPPDFEFDYSFQIRSFKMTMQRGFNTNHYESQSSKLTDEMIKQIKNSNRGQSIIFEDIVALSPEGANRTLSPLMITIN